MTALLTDNLPLLAGAPNGIKKLRELILELAVRGKLVPQDPNDEPASELLKRIAEEKVRLLAEGKIKKQKALAEIAQDEKPLELPKGWGWSRLGDLILEAYTGLDRGKSLQGVDLQYPYFKMNNILNQGGYTASEMTRVDAAPEEIDKYCLCSGDLLFNTRNSRELVGKTCVIRELPESIVLYNNNILRCKLHRSVLPEVIDFWLRSTTGGDLLNSIKSNTTNVCAIYQGNLFDVLCPVIPSTEQHRIIAKVEELMALCDRLEAQQADAENAHTQLVQALLDSLTQASDANDFATNWQRLAEHFHTLFSTEPSIDALKQTLLQLAVMGRLAPQYPSDEPASELLKRIAEKKARLVVEGKARKPKPLLAINEDERSFELPKGWEWARLEEMSYVFSGNAFKSEDFQEGSGVRVIKITNAGVGEFIKTDDYLPVGYEHEHASFRVLEGDLILALTRPYISTGLKISKCPAEYDGALLNQRVAAIRLSSEMNNKFGFLFFKSPIVLAIYQERFGNSGLQPNLKMSDVTSLLVPIPPAEEQHRIVAKVDQLMALCDQLKTRLTQARQLNEQLASTLVEQAVA